MTCREAKTCVQRHHGMPVGLNLVLSADTTPIGSGASGAQLTKAAVTASHGSSSATGCLHACSSPARSRGGTVCTCWLGYS